MEKMFGIYDDFFEVKRDLEIGVYLIESIILNGKNDTANKYLMRALPEMKKALSYMSDAEFELCTSPADGFKKRRKLRTPCFEVLTL